MPQFNKNKSDDYYDENDDAFVDGKYLLFSRDKINIFISIHNHIYKNKDSIIIEDPNLKLEADNNETSSKMDLNSYLVSIYQQIFLLRFR